MKIDVTTVLLDINGLSLLDAEQKPLTLRSVLQTVLLSALKGDEEMAGEDKAKLWNMASDTRADKVDWSPEQVSIVRRRIGLGYTPVVVGPAFQLLS